MGNRPGLAGGWKRGRMQALLIGGVLMRRVGSSKLRSFDDIRPTEGGGMQWGPGECGLLPALRVAKHGMFGNIRPIRMKR